MTENEDRRPPGQGSGDPKIIASNDSIYVDSTAVTPGQATPNRPQDVYDWPDYSKITDAYAAALWEADMAALEDQMDEIETIFWAANFVSIFDPNAPEPDDDCPTCAARYEATLCRGKNGCDQ